MRSRVGLLASSASDIRSVLPPPPTPPVVVVALPHRCNVRDDEVAGENARVHDVEFKRPTRRRRGDMRFILSAKIIRIPPNVRLPLLQESGGTLGERARREPELRAY